MRIDLDIKPSEVLLSSFPPLTGCFNHTEAELAAAMIVRALAELGDTWRPIMWAEMQPVWKADLEAGKLPVHAILNSFVRPDVYKLIDEGFIVAPVVDVVDNKTAGPFEFTPAAINRMRRRWDIRCRTVRIAFAGGGYFVDEKRFAEKVAEASSLLAARGHDPARAVWSAEENGHYYAITAEAP